MLDANSVTTAVKQTLSAVGAGLNLGVTYVSVPIKTGRREFELLRRLGCSRETLRTRHFDEWRRLVVDPNLKDAAQFSIAARRQYPNSLVLNPSCLEVHGLEPADYHSLWQEVILSHARQVVATPDWALSEGSRKEINRAQEMGRPIVDQFGVTLGPTDLTAGDRRARDHLISEGWSHSEIDELLPPILDIRGQVGKEPVRDEPTHIEIALQWLQLERRLQRRFYARLDDDRTRNSFHDTSETSWWYRLHKYWDQAEIASMSSVKGREFLAKFTAVAVGMLESIVRVHGELPEPAIPSTENPDRLVPQARRKKLGHSEELSEIEANEVGAIVFAWLSRERLEYVKPGTRPGVDKTHLDEGLGRGSFWHKQLFDVYWNRGVALGPETLAGRQQFAKFTSTCIALLETVLREEGPLPPRRYEL